MTRLRGWISAAGLAAALGVLGATARAADPTEIDEHVAALASDDEARRAAAVAAVAKMTPDDLPALIAALSAGDERAWPRFAEAVGRWDAPTAVDALSRTRLRWPSSARRAMDVAIHDLRLRTPIGDGPDTGTSPADVAAVVRRTLAALEHATMRSAGSGSVRTLVALGRPAIPELIAVLAARPADTSFDVVAASAAEALAELTDERDAPALTHLLLSGCSHAAQAFPDDAQAAKLDALVAAAERDLVNSRLVEGRRGGADVDPRLADALLGYVERNPRARVVGDVAECLDAARCIAAVPALRTALAATSYAQTKSKIAAALAGLGQKDGITALVELVEAPGDTWARHGAANALNAIVGRRVYDGRDARGVYTATGKYDDCAREFRAWWDANVETARFDSDLRRWRTADDPLDLATSPPEVAAKVGALLAPFEGVNRWSQSDPVVGRLEDLGHDAVPALLEVLAGLRTRDWAVGSAASAALSRLIGERDVPAVARLLASGHEDAAGCLAKMHSDAARDALLGAVRAGFFGHDVLEALRAYADQPATQDALLAALESPTTTSDSDAANVCRFLAAAGASRAIEPTRRLHRACVDADARPIFADALARLGCREGLDDLVAVVPVRGVSSYARREAAEALDRLLGQHFYAGGWSPWSDGAELDRAGSELTAWWSAHADRLRFDAANRRWVDQDAPAALDVGTSPTEVARRVAEICARVAGRNGFSGNGGDDVDDLVDLGREAIPALVARIREAGAGEFRDRNSSRAAAEALCRLRTDADVPMLAALMNEGHTVVASSLKGCRDPRARDALLAAIAGGEDEMDLMRALATIPIDPATWDAVRAWLGRPGPKQGFWLADFLESHATDDAVPVLREILAAKDVDSILRVRCAGALAFLGRKDGIVALLDLVDAAPVQSNSNMRWGQNVRAMAAERLNAVAGQRIWFREPEDGLMRGLPKDLLSPRSRVGDDDPLSPVPAATVKRFRAWWTENAERLTFDPGRRVWSTEALAPIVSAAVPQTIEDEIVQIVADLRGAGMFMSGSPRSPPLDPHTARLVALGRDALPALVRRVRAARPWEEGHGTDVSVTAAADAVMALAGDADAPLLLDLLREGRVQVAEWFDVVPSPEARDALLGVVARGWLDGGMIRALKPYAGDPVVHAALATWAEHFGTVERWEAPALAEILGTPAEGTTTPMPEDLLDRPLPPRLRWQVAAALAKNGSLPALTALVRSFDDRTGLDGEDLGGMALALNDAAGTQVVDVTPDAPEHPLGGVLPRSVRFAERPAVRDAAAAAAAVAAWWKETGTKLRFDAAARKWTVEP